MKRWQTWTRKTDWPRSGFSNVVCVVIPVEQCDSYERFALKFCQRLRTLEKTYRAALRNFPPPREKSSKVESFAEKFESCGLLQHWHDISALNDTFQRKKSGPFKRTNDPNWLNAAILIIRCNNRVFSIRWYRGTVVYRNAGQWQ